MFEFPRKDELANEGPGAKAVSIQLLKVLGIPIPKTYFIDNIIQEGTILYLDDYFAGYKGNPNKGVALAFSTFQKKSKFSFTFYQNVAHIGRAYIAYPK